MHLCSNLQLKFMTIWILGKFEKLHTFRCFHHVKRKRKLLEKRFEGNFFSKKRHAWRTGKNIPRSHPVSENCINWDTICCFSKECKKIQDKKWKIWKEKRKSCRKKCNNKLFSLRLRWNSERKKSGAPTEKLARNFYLDFSLFQRLSYWNALIILHHITYWCYVFLFLDCLLFIDMHWWICWKEF